MWMILLTAFLLQEKHSTDFCNILFYQEGKSPEQNTSVYLNYCVSVLPNTLGQLCLPEETGVPRETHNF